MRDWNIQVQSLTALIILFVSYLWGIETQQHSMILPPQLVCILPMRDWNPAEINVETVKNLVCILPMRDWNSQKWKISIVSSIVCILPMRDWNPIRRNLNFQALFVCILPMRDWNIVYRTWEKYVCLVCILPMRDWNYKANRHQGWFLAGLYLTYEGLKR